MYSVPGLIGGNESFGGYLFTSMAQSRIKVASPVCHLATVVFPRICIMVFP